MEELEKDIESKAMAIVNKENVLVEQKPQEEIDLSSLQAQYLKKQVEEGKSIADITSDFAKAKVTSDIMRNDSGEYDKLHKELAEEEKGTLKESFKQDRVRKQTETLNEKQKKAEAFYISFRPILEFDFSPLIHKKDNDKEPKSYKDRSYGIPLMVLMLILFVAPYCVFSIVLALFNGINAIFEAIATFGKVARTIALSVFVLVILVLIVYFAMLGIDALFGTNLIGFLSNLA